MIQSGYMSVAEMPRLWTPAEQSPYRKSLLVVPYYEEVPNILPDEMLAELEREIEQLPERKVAYPLAGWEGSADLGLTTPAPPIVERVAQDIMQRSNGFVF